MILWGTNSRVGIVGIPRESGDDPSMMFDDFDTILYSPRERG